MNAPSCDDELRAERKRKESDVARRERVPADIRPPQISANARGRSTGSRVDCSDRTAFPRLHAVAM